MNRKVFYGLLGLCFLVIVFVNVLYNIQPVVRIVLCSASIISYGLWFFDIYHRNMTYEEKFLYDVFLICSVRNISQEELEEVKAYVDDLEKNEGLKVYWPYRDTIQGDPVGDRICRDNRRAMKLSKEIDVWWNPESIGSHYDFGVASAYADIFGHPICPVNMQQFERIEGKSFSNILHKLADEIDKKEV